MSVPQAVLPRTHTILDLNGCVNLVVDPPTGTTLLNGTLKAVDQAFNPIISNPALVSGRMDQDHILSNRGRRAEKNRRGPGERQVSIEIAKQSSENTGELKPVWYDKKVMIRRQRVCHTVISALHVIDLKLLAR